MGRSKINPANKEKGKHSSPETAGEKNMPKSYLNKNEGTMPEGEMANIYQVWNAGLHMRSIREDYKGQWDEDSLATYIDGYFQFCAKKDMKPSKVGLQLWLGVSKSQYWEWETKPEKHTFKTNLVLMANQVMEMQYVSRVEKYPAGNIFLLKSGYGYKDNPEVIVRHEGNSVESKDELESSLKKLGLVSGEDEEE